MRDLALLLLILFAATVLRGFYLRERSEAPDFTYPAIDAGFHDYWARQMALPDWEPPTHVRDPGIADSPYLRPPGYPYFLAGVYSIFGDGYMAPRVVQMLLGLGSAWLAFVFAKRWFGGPVGLAFAALMGLYWVPIYFEGELHAPVLSMFLTLALLYLAGRWAERPVLPWALAAGLSIGLAALVRPNALLFFPVLLVWGLWVARRAQARGVFPGLLLGSSLGLVLAVAPATWRNHRVADDFVLITSNAGINLFIGNNEEATGYVAQELGDLGAFATCYDYPALVENLEQKLGRKLKHSQVSSYFARRALSYIREHPGAFLRLCLLKAALFWGPTEIAHNKIVALEREHSAILRWLPGNFPFILSLSLLGLFWFQLERRQRLSTNEKSPGELIEEERAWEVGALVAFLGLAYFFSVLPFFAAARYRVPILPMLMLFAAIGLVRSFEAFQSGKKQRRRQALLVILALPLVYLVVGWQYVPYAQNINKFHMDRGRALNRGRHHAEALEEFRQALAARPQSADTHFSMGLTVGELGQRDAAISHYRQALQSNPNHSGALVNLGSLLASQGELPEAIESFLRAIELDPRSAGAYANLGTAYLKAGRTADALEALRKRLELEPTSGKAHRDLGRASMAAGAFEDALSSYRKALTFDPGNPALQIDMAWLLATCPAATLRDGKRALELAQAACRGAGQQRPAFLGTLAAAQAEVGEFALAIETVRHAIELARSRKQEGRVRSLESALQYYESGQAFRIHR